MNSDGDSKPRSNQPAVYGVHRSRSQWRFSRRGFVSAAGLASAAMLAHLGRHPEAQALGVEALPEPSDDVLMGLEPGQRFEKTWQLRNAGAQPWGDDAELRLIDPAGLAAPASYRLPNLQPGESVTLRVNLVAPETPGVTQSQWRVSANGVLSQTLYLPIMVQGDDNYPTLTPTHTPDVTPWPPGSCIVESPHPYNETQEWYITNPDPNAWATRLHLQRLDIAGANWLYFYSGNSTLYTCFLGSGDNGYDFWTETIEGRVVRIELHVYDSDDRWGFCIDNIESVVEPTATPTRTPCASHCSCTCTSYRPCSCNWQVCTCDKVTICTCNLVYYEQ